MLPNGKIHSRPMDGAEETYLRASFGALSRLFESVQTYVLSVGVPSMAWEQGCFPCAFVVFSLDRVSCLGLS